MADAADSYRQQAFGSGPDDLNLHAVRARVYELHQTVTQLLTDLQAQGGDWHRLLDKLAVINVQHTAILQQLRPLTKNYVLHPRAPSQPGLLADLAPQVPVLLASRLLPEQEAEDAGVLGALPGGLSSAAAADALHQAESALSNLRAAVAHLLTASLGDDSSGVLDPKQSALRRGVDDTSREIQRALAQQRAARGGAGSRKRGRDGDPAAPPPTAPGAGAQAQQAHAAAQQSMDAILAGVMNGSVYKQAL